MVPAKTPVAMGSVLVTPGTNFFTTEDHGTATFSVELSEALIAKNAKKPVTVTIPISSSDPGEGTVNVGELVFSVANGQSAKTVVITGVDDALMDGDVAYSVTVGKIKVKNAKNYNNRINPQDLSLVNKDNDQLDPGLIFSRTELTVNDASSAGVAIRLASRPTSNVHVQLDVTEGSDQGIISWNELTFTPSNWNVPQEFFIGMYLDGLHDGDREFEISIDTTSADLDYDDLPTEFVTAVNQDIDPLETSLTGQYIGSYQTIDFSEGFHGLPSLGGDVVFSLEDGFVTVAGPGVGQGTYEDDQITFTVDGGETFTGTMTFTGQFTENFDDSVTVSGVWVYVSNVSPEAVGFWSASGPNLGVPGFQVSPSGNLSVTEGGIRNLAITLKTQPLSDVEISFVMSDGTGEAQLSTSFLIFTPNNWSTPQSLTITGVQDNVADGNQDFVFIAQVNSIDPNYFSVPGQTLTVVVEDSATVIQNLDGFYEGTFDGLVNILGSDTVVTGPVAFEVSGDQVNVTAPAPAVGTVNGGVSSFLAQSGPFSGAEFTGSYTENPDGSITASGTWTIDVPGVLGSGIWSAIRPALAP